MSRMLSAALRYAANSWAVFPCKPGEKVPATKHGCHDATLDKSRIRSWWSAGEYNIGVATGPASGIYVLDVDGDEGLDALVDLGHGIPSTLTQHTPSGGLHLVFRWPDVTVGNSARKLGANLDTRGDGGYIVVAPSLHPNGGRYRWAGPGRPQSVPGWLLRLVRDTPNPSKPRKPERIDDDTRLERYVATALEDECATVAATARGGRNHQLHVSAVKLGTLVGSGALDSETAFRSLLQAAEACGHVRDDGERMARKTIQSGLTFGMKHPREEVAS